MSFPLLLVSLLSVALRLFSLYQRSELPFLFLSNSNLLFFSVQSSVLSTPFFFHLHLSVASLIFIWSRFYFICFFYPEIRNFCFEFFFIILNFKKTFIIILSVLWTSHFFWISYFFLFKFFHHYLFYLICIFLYLNFFILSDHCIFLKKIWISGLLFF